MKAIFALVVIAVVVVHAAVEVSVPCAGGLCDFAVLKQALENAQDGDRLTLASGTYQMPCDGKLTSVKAKGLTIDASMVAIYPKASWIDGKLTPATPYDANTACAPIEFTATEGVTTIVGGYIGLPVWSVKFASEGVFRSSFFVNNMRDFYMGVMNTPRLALSAVGKLTLDAVNMRSLELDLASPSASISGTTSDIMLCGCEAGKDKMDGGCIALNELMSTMNLVCAGDDRGDMGSSPDPMDPMNPMDPPMSSPGKAAVLIYPVDPVDCSSNSWVTPIGIGFVLGMVFSTVRRLACRFIRARMARQNGSNVVVSAVDSASPPGYETVATRDVEEKVMTEKV